MRNLRNDMQVRYKPVRTAKNATGWVHGVDAEGFSVRFDDGMSLPYSWYDERFFEVVKTPAPNVCDEVAQALTVERLNRDRVEELLALYRDGLALDLEEIASDVATTEKYRHGMRMAANRLRKASDR